MSRSHISAHYKGEIQTRYLCFKLTKPIIKKINQCYAKLLDKLLETWFMSQKLELCQI